MATGTHALLRVRQRGLLLTAALCYCFVPSYGPHQSASTVICASSPPIAADEASWEAQVYSFSKAGLIFAFGKYRSAGRGQGWRGTGTGTGTNRRPLLQAPLRGALRWPFIWCPSTYKKHAPASSDGLPGAPRLRARPWLCRKVFPNTI